jgi:hypothetical protein
MVRHFNIPFLRVFRGRLQKPRRPSRPVERVCTVQARANGARPPCSVSGCWSLGNLRDGFRYSFWLVPEC